jgi:hypothetical protein
LNGLLVAALLLGPGGGPKVAPALESWYGPAEIRFNVPNLSDPYDPGKTDVQVKFDGPGRIETRLAYFDGKGWRVRLLAPIPGDYTPHVWVNGQENTNVKLEPITVSQRIPLNFVRIDGSANAFATSDGNRYWPVGHNLAWSSKERPLEDQMPAMHDAGLNWARIWNTYWDGRCPYWSPTKKLKPYEIDQDAMTKWDTIVRTAEKYDIKFQWVLHHHGQVSSTVNPNWPDHPWNAKNGGFLKSSEDFFTDAEAKRRTKAMLRYLVARYADSPSIMAWELFNEVQFSDAARNNHWDKVGAWHDEMAAYLREIDPYHHLITTSSEQGQPIWKATDYRNDHGYPENLEALLLGTKAPDKQPFFFGEVGLADGTPTAASEKAAIRDGIWSGVLAGHAGSGEYWSWDRIEPMGLYDEYARSTKIFDLIHLLDNTPMKAAPVTVRSELGRDLNVAPGRGWAKSEKQDFIFPSEADSASLGQLSSFLQGSAHPEMSKPDLRITFIAPKAGTFSVKFGEVSAGGTSVKISLDGAEMQNLAFAGGAKPAKPVSFPFSAGAHTVVIHNGGGDWITISQISVTGMAPQVSGEAATSGHLVLIRLHSAGGAPTFSVSGLGIVDGPTRVRVFDLDTGAAFDEDTTCENGVLKGFPLHAADVVVAIVR